VSLFRSSVRPSAVLSDEAVERYLAAVRAHVDPDPAFRRRLRGVVLNQFVATREGSHAGLVPRAMGRLGRSVLYASFALGVSVTGVMAASEIAVPGDALYPLKRAIEDLRVDVLPEQFADELVVYELNERFSELAVLVERDDEARIETLAAEVATEYASVISKAAADGEPLDRRTEVLTSLIARLPEQARVAIDRAITAPGAMADPSDASDGTTPGAGGPAANPAPGTGGSADGGQGGGTGSGAEEGNGQGTGPGSGNGNASTNGSSGNGSSTDGQGTGGRADDGDEADQPTATPEPSATPKPKKSPKP
jgi:Domain of unknown function (DUF5667)